MSTLDRLKCGCANCFVAASGHAPDNQIIRCHKTREIVFPGFVVNLVEAAKIARKEIDDDFYLADVLDKALAES